jgi:uncharacterized protein (TIGR02118 family)
MAVIAALRRAPFPESADAVFVPTDEGVGGRDDEITAVAAWNGDTTPAELEALDVAEAYCVEPRMQWDIGDATVTRISFVRRASGLTRDEFAHHWSERHAPLARVHHPGICRYVQNVVVEALTPDAPEIDGIAELGFASLADLRERMYDSPEGQQIIREDVLRFIDLGRGAGWRMVARPAASAR